MYVVGTYDGIKLLDTFYLISATKSRLEASVQVAHLLKNDVEIEKIIVLKALDALSIFEYDLRKNPEKFSKIFVDNSGIKPEEDDPF